MADAPQNIDGLAMVEAEIRLPTSNQLVPVITAENIFHSAAITETVLGYSQWTLNFQTTNRNFVDTLLRKATSLGSPHIRLRYGFGTAGGSVSWNSWQDYIIRSDVSKIIGIGNGAGYLATFVCADPLFEVHRYTTTTVRKGKISDIVKSIADSYGFPCVVEPTKFEGIWIQSYISDYEFVLSRMVPRALNDKGRGNYKFFFKDGALHFHSVDYQADVKEFVYYASSSVSLRHVDGTQDRIDAGSAGCRMVLCDPYSGIRQSVDSSPGLALRLGNTLPDVNGVPALKKNIPYHLGANRISEATAIGQSIYERTRAGNYRLELDISKSIFFRAGDLVNMVINPSQSQTTPTSGMYYVPVVNYNIQSTAITAKVLLERGEYYINQSAHSQLAQQGQNILSPPSAAPGQTLNISDASTSVTTKGAGKESSRRTFLDAKNPNSAVS